MDAVYGKMHSTALASPAMRHVPLDLQPFILASSSWSYMKYKSNLLCQITSESYVPLLPCTILPCKIMYTFHILEENEKRYRFFQPNGIRVSCQFMCDLRYLHVILWPSSHQILGMPLYGLVTI